MLERHFAEDSLHGDPILERGLELFLFMQPEHTKFLWLQITETSISGLSFTEISQKAELLPGKEMAPPDNAVAQALFLLEPNLKMLER